jgi:hypothetical protein
LQTFWLCTRHTNNHIKQKNITMKSILLFVGVFTTSLAFAQPKMITSATITTITTVIAPEEEDVSQVGQGQGVRMNFMAMMDGETKTTTWLKNDLVKTAIKSEIIKATIYRNNTTKVTNTVMNRMGITTGSTSTDADLETMKKKMDSAMAERAKTDTNMKRRTRNVDFPATVSYIEESKKIGGFNCKKAIIITDKILSKDSMVVWYCPEFKINSVASTGGFSNIPMAARFMGGSGKDNFELVNGFVMMYDRKLPGGRRMEVKVSKIDFTTDISDKEFELPKDVEFKPMSEFGRGVREGGAFR